jgi:hypothetical protein
VRLEELSKLTEFNYLAGSGTHDLPVCITVSEPVGYRHLCNVTHSMMLMITGETAATQEPPSIHGCRMLPTSGTCLTIAKNRDVTDFRNMSHDCEEPRSCTSSSISSAEHFQ